MRIQTTHTELFEFAELSEDAQQAAIDSARELAAGDTFWSEHVLENAKDFGAMLGIDVQDIFFSGFYSQGDGAQFVGTYSYNKGGAKRLIEECPQDVELKLIAEGLQDIQRRNFYQLSANVATSGHYSHSFCTNIVVHDSRHYDATLEVDEIVSQLLRDFMDWIYSSLGKAYDWETSEENARDYLIDSGQEFTDTGVLA